MNFFSDEKNIKINTSELNSQVQSKLEKILSEVAEKEKILFEENIIDYTEKEKNRLDLLTKSLMSKQVHKNFKSDYEFIVEES